MDSRGITILYFYRIGAIMFLYNIRDGFKMGCPFQCQEVTFPMQ